MRFKHTLTVFGNNDNVCGVKEKQVKDATTIACKSGEREWN